MVYRNDIDALEARHAALAAEVAERTRDRDELARMLAAARAQDDYARELAERPARRRRRQRIVMIAMLAGLGMFGGVIKYRCANPARDRMEEALDRMQQFSNQVCACTTKACAQGVIDTMTEWGREMAKQAPDAKPDPDTMKRAEKIVARLTECMTRAMSSDIQ
jgi:hypothetical protein